MIRANENFRLTCKTLKTTFLTVDDATYQGKPTPRKPWVLLSFSDSQPPILFSFMDGESALRVDGKPGDYTLKFSPTYRGWIRVCLPFGQTQFKMDSGPAAAFGAAAAKIKQEIAYWRAPMPKAVAHKAEWVEKGIVATWQFAKPGTLVPSSLVLAQSGGYGVKILSQISIAEGSLSQGPQGFCVGTELKVFFPVRRAPVGRPLTVGDPPKIERTTGLSGLPAAWLACSPDSYLDQIQKASLTSTAGLALAPEPNSGALAYDAATLTKGAEGALIEAITQGVGGAPIARPSINKLIWRRDWWTLCLFYPDSPAVVKAQEQTAIAAWFSQEPGRVLEGCLLASGMASAWAEPAYRTAFNFPNKITNWTTKPESFFQWIYRLKQEPDAYFAPFTSPVFSTDPRALIVKQKGSSYSIAWTHQEGDLKSLRFISKPGVKFEAGANLNSITVETSGEESVVKYNPAKPGNCELTLTLPAGTSLPITPMPLDLAWR